MNPKFSIIIPVYNVEKYLHECLDSVLNQTYSGSYEVICVNDGSTDSSLEILRKYAEKYSKLNVIDTPNGGTAFARNIGVKASKGEYIWFVDSDDWVKLNSLQVLSDRLELSKPDVLCFNGKLCYEEDGREEQDEGIVENGLTGWEYYNKYALQSRKFHFVCVVLRLYRREFILKNNLFFETGILHEDNLWVPQMCYYAESISSVADLVYIYRIREGSKMQTVSERKVLDIIRVANKLSEFFIPKKDIDKSVVYREIAGEYFSVYMPPKSDVLENDFSEVHKLINWSNYKQVSVYPRHKRIYRLIKLHPTLFRLYLKVESLLKGR